MSTTAEEPRKPYLPAMGRDRLLPLYDPLQRLLGMGLVHRWLVDQARIQPEQRVLELGCGTGNLAILVKRLHPGAEVVGIDPDPKALARAQRKAGREELPYPDGSFDRVLSALMFHHLGPEEQEKSLDEARRVLKPGGSLHLLDFGGAKVRSAGFLARLHHRGERLRNNLGDRIPTLMGEAGFADPTEVASRGTIAGRLTYYRASALREGSEAHHST